MTNTKAIKDSGQKPSFLNVKRVNVEGFEGDTTRTFEYLERKDSVGVLIYHTDKQLFTWVKQFRIGQATKDEGSGLDYTIEPVAGMIDAGQTPLMAASRECFEETGIVEPKLTPITSFLMCAGITNERMHLYFCEVEGQTLNARGGLVDEDEDIDVLHWSALETKEAFEEGKMRNAQAMILWQWACLHKPELMQNIGYSGAGLEP